MILYLLACVPRGDRVDFDGDGFDASEDCDDRNALAFPGAAENPYDGIDQDCDGEDLRDADGDGVSFEEDCDDNSANVFPGNVDVPYDGVDADCGGNSDFDADGDGSDAVEYGGDDCDDNDPDLSGNDLDGDGYSACSGDCNDNRPAVNPGAERICGNGLDDDCDGEPECGISGRYDADELDAQIAGLTFADRVGRALAVLDDLDGDGRSDLAVGGYQSFDGNGAVHVITRPRDGLVSQDHTTIVGSGSFGFSVAAADEGVLVGSLTGTDFLWAGAAYLFTGPWNGAVLDEHDATLILEGQNSNDRAGWTVKWVDLGGPFIAVGAVSHDVGLTESGAVYFVPHTWTGIHNLSEAIVIGGELAWSRAGYSIAQATDLTGDGDNDLWISAPGATIGLPMPGTVYLFAGLPALNVADSGVSMVGEADRDLFGYQIAAGDANGDGIDDLLVGAPGNTAGGEGAGAAYLFYGPHDGERLAVDADLIVRGRPGYELGAAVELVDLDEDGSADVVVGGPGANDSDGGVAIFYAASGWSDEVDVLSGDATIQGEFESRLGVALAGGHLGGPPGPDIAMGADEALVTGGNAGAVTIGWGGDGSF